ncbi:hypothetical protein BGZ76_008461, partial [Entomortierella beljakovae]
MASPQYLEQDEELGDLPRGCFINHNNVRTKAYRDHLVVTQKSRDVVQSVKLWLEEIELGGGKAVFVDNEPNFMIAWSSKFQLKFMGNNKLIACMDSTHKTVK